MKRQRRAQLEAMSLTELMAEIAICGAALTRHDVRSNAQAVDYWMMRKTSAMAWHAIVGEQLELEQLGEGQQVAADADVGVTSCDAGCKCVTCGKDMPPTPGHPDWC
jgi:hypothetical protein